MKLLVTFIRKYGAPFLLICTFFFLITQAGFAQGGTQAGVFEVPEIRPGVLVEVPVEIRDVVDLYAFDIELSYDPEYLEFEDADPNKDGIQPGFGTFLDPGMTLVNIIDPEEGLIHVLMTQVNPAEPKSGSGNLLVLYMTGLKTGQTTLEVTKVELSTRYGEAIPVSGMDAEIVIAAEAPVVTATPIPVIDPIEITEIPTLDPYILTPSPTPAPSATPMPTPTGTAIPVATATGEALEEVEVVETTEEPEVVAPIEPTAELEVAGDVDSEGEQEPEEQENGSLWWLLGLPLVIIGAVVVFTRRKQVDKPDQTDHTGGNNEG